MNSCNDETVRRRNAVAIDMRENDGGAPARDSPDHIYGRRIEVDRSWTVYHVYTGVPAHESGYPMTGLSRSEATGGMLSLNHRNAERRKGQHDLGGQVPHMASGTEVGGT